MAVAEQTIQSLAEAAPEALCALDAMSQAQENITLAEKMRREWQEVYDRYNGAQIFPELPEYLAYTWSIGNTCLIAASRNFIDQPFWNFYELDTTANVGQIFTGNKISPFPTSGADHDLSMSSRCPAGLIRVDGLNQDGERPTHGYQLLLRRSEIGSLAIATLADIPRTQRFWPFDAYIKPPLEPVK